MTSDEIWKPVKTLETRLMVSNLGRLRHVRHGMPGNPYSPKPDRRGYSHIRPRNDHDSKDCIRVHHAVWTAFVGPIPEGCTLDHIDRNRSNNSLCNLRVANSVQQRENTKKHKRRRDAREIEVWRLDDPTNVMLFEHSRQAAEKLGANQRALRSVANGKVKRTGNFSARWAQTSNFLEGEEFREVVLRDCKVNVSNKGRLLDKSKAFAVTPTVTEGNDYPTCGSRSVQMHRAVAFAWPELVEGSPLPGWTVDHIDRNVNNNHPSNLRWLTPKQQAANRGNSRQSSDHDINEHPNTKPA